jgi:GxxExxY protein
LTCRAQKLVRPTKTNHFKQERAEVAEKISVRHGFDVLIEGCVLVEAKAVVEVLPIHKAQLLSYLKLMNVPIGRLINFHALRLVDGVHRLVLPGADR